MISAKSYINTILLLLALVPAVSQGKFIDSSVEGLSPASGKESDLTKANTLLSFAKGKTITFSIGGIELGTGTPIASPVALVADTAANTDENSLSVVPILTGNELLITHTEKSQADLKKSLLTLLEGNYRGTFSGGDTGKWNLTITTNGVDGVIRGYSSNLSGSQIRMFTGSVASNGAISTSDSGWEAEIDVATGNIFGSWADNESGKALSGDFSGKKIE